MRSIPVFFALLAILVAGSYVFIPGQRPESEDVSYNASGFSYDAPQGYKQVQSGSYDFLVVEGGKSQDGVKFVGFKTYTGDFSGVSARDAERLISERFLSGQDPGFQVLDTENGVKVNSRNYSLLKYSLVENGRRYTHLTFSTSLSGDALLVDFSDLEDFERSKAVSHLERISYS